MFEFLKYPLKTAETYLQYAPLAETLNFGIIEQSKKQNIFGIFGETPLSKLVSIPNQIPFDPMHLTLQGHGKWFYGNITTNKECDAYIG